MRDRIPRQWRGSLVAGLALAALVAATLLTPGGAGLAQASEAGSGEPTLTATGTATVYGDPDRATVTVGGQFDAGTAAAASAQANAAIAAIGKALEGIGISKDDIRTTQFDIGPVYGEASAKVTGFRATESLTVTVEDISKVSAVLDTALAAGANQIQGVQFAFKDASALRQQAIAAAVKDARTQAQAAAAAEGLTILGVKDIQIQNPGPIVMYKQMRLAAESASATIYPGQESLSVTVQVIYNLGH